MSRAATPRRKSGARALLAIAAGLALIAAPLAGPAQAVDPSHGAPGFCPGDEGVTVVIDFQALGGTTIVRCAPGPVGPGFTGHSALLDAGIQIAGTRRWGEAFICRLEERPGPNEIVPIQGKPKYKEPCIDTPPASGYWSYWHATNGGQWQYSQWGVKNRNALRGGFEGWSFSLNATAQSNPKPRITPRRPNSAPQPTVNVPTNKPTSNDPGENQQPGAPQDSNQPNGQGENPGSDTTTTIGPNQSQQNPAGPQNPATPGSTTNGPGQPTSTALPPGLPRGGGQRLPAGDPRATSAPTKDVEWTGGEVVASGTTQGRSPGGVPVPTIIGGFLVIALLVAALLTARRRRTNS